MTRKDTAQDAARPVESVDKSTGKPFAQIYLSEDLRRQKPGIIKTYAALIATSYPDENGQRVSKATVREIARRGQISDDTARRNLLYLSDETQLIVDSPTETGRIYVIMPADGPWSNLDHDHPAWSLNPLEFCVYLALKRFDGPKGCIVTNATLSEFLFTTPKNIEKSMHALREAGAIACDYRTKPTGSTVVKNRRVILQSRNRWKISAADPVEDQPQKVGDKYIIPTFCGTPDQPQKVGMGAAKSRDGVPQKVGMDLESLRESEENTHTTRTHAREAEPQTPAGVCVLQSFTDPKDKTQTPCDRFLQNIQGFLNEKTKTISSKIEIEEEIRSLFSEHGWIPETFVKEAFSKVNSETIHTEIIVKKALSNWPNLKSDARRRFLSFDEKVSWDNGLKPVDERTFERMQSVPEETRNYIQWAGIAQKVDNFWWIKPDEIALVLSNPQKYQARKRSDVTTDTPR